MGDCRFCDDGRFEITVCGWDYVGGEILESIRYAELAEHHLPVAGGMLDQAAWFVDLLATYRGEVARIEAEELEKIRRQSRSRRR